MARDGQFVVYVITNFIRILGPINTIFNLSLPAVCDAVIAVTIHLSNSAGVGLIIACEDNGGYK